jgi:hypothetical protein
MLSPPDRIAIALMVAATLSLGKHYQSSALFPLPIELKQQSTCQSADCLVALRTGRPLSACAGSQELLPLSQALAFGFHPCWATGQNLTQRLRWVTSWSLPSSSFVRHNQFLSENFLRNAGFEPDIAPSRTFKNPLDDFSKELAARIHPAHDPPVPLFCTEPEISESIGTVHGCRGAEAPAKTIA